MPSATYRTDSYLHDAAERSMPYRGDAMASLRQCGQRLGLVRRLRSRKTKAQSWQRAGSRINRLVLSRAMVFTTWIKCSSTCRSGMPSICANW